MPTFDEINSQIKNLGGIESFLGRREIKELPNILWHDEIVENIVQGMYNNANGILVATNRRLIFVDKGFLFGLKVEDFALDKISSIQYETGLLTGKLTIFTSGNKAVINNIAKNKVRTFGDFVRAKISTPKPNYTETTHSDSDVPQKNALELLERLAKLKDQGVLTDEEFALQKKKILGL